MSIACGACDRTAMNTISKAVVRMSERREKRGIGQLYERRKQRVRRTFRTTNSLMITLGHRRSYSAANSGAGDPASLGGFRRASTSATNCMSPFKT